MSYLFHAQVEKMLAGIHPGRVGRDGKGFSHVEAYEMRATMNRLFGFLRWSEEVIDQTLIFEQVEERANNRHVWTVAYRSLVCVKICAPEDGEVLAVYTEGAVGDAQFQPSRADAHDLALKTSQSQAFKRAVANIGDVAGLSLYNNGSVQPIVGFTMVMPPSPEPTADEAEPEEEEIPNVLVEILGAETIDDVDPETQQGESWTTP